jgi:hypothetical protein
MEIARQRGNKSYLPVVEAIAEGVADVVTHLAEFQP